MVKNFGRITASAISVDFSETLVSGCKNAECHTAECRNLKFVTIFISPQLQLHEMA